MTLESSLRPTPRSEPLSWNPILELMEASSILSRRQNSKFRELDYEKEVARLANEKFTKGHEDEKIVFVIQGVNPLSFNDNGDVVQFLSNTFEFQLLGFEKRNGQWYLAVNKDQESDNWFIPVGQIKDSRQIISFKTYPK